MSFGYANGKKLRKRTRIANLHHEIDKLKSLLLALLQGHSIIKTLLDELAKEENWLVKEDDADEAGHTPPPDYIWNGGGNPAEKVKAVIVEAESILQQASFRVLKTQAAKDVTEEGKDKPDTDVANTLPADAEQAA